MEAIAAWNRYDVCGKSLDEFGRPCRFVQPVRRRFALTDGSTGEDFPRAVSHNVVISPRLMLTVLPGHCFRSLTVLFENPVKQEVVP